MKNFFRLITFAAAFSFFFLACGDVTDGPAGWTLVSNSTFGNNAINAVAFGNDVFVAVGAGGRMARSADGINWTAVSDTTFGNNAINAVAFGNGRFIAGGDGGRMAFSADNGVTWTAIANNGFLINAIYGIAYGDVGGGRWVAVGRLRMSYSTNAQGTAWTGSSSNDPFGFGQGAPTLRDVVFGDDRFVLVGAGGGQGHSASLADSANGINWTARDMDELLVVPIRSVSFGNGKFVAAVDNMNMILYSADGAEWNEAEAIPMSTQLFGIAAGGGKFISVGAHGAIYQSDNGITWTRFPDVTLNNHFRDIVYGNGTWVAVGLSGAIAYLAD